MDSHLNDNLEEVAGRFGTRSASDLEHQEQIELDLETALGRKRGELEEYTAPAGSLQELKPVLEALASATDPLLTAAINRYHSDPVHHDPAGAEERASLNIVLSLSVWTCLFAQSLLKAHPYGRDMRLNGMARDHLIYAIRDSVSATPLLAERFAASLEPLIEEIAAGDQEAQVELREALSHLREEMPGYLWTTLRDLNAEQLQRVAIVARATALGMVSPWTC